MKEYKFEDFSIGNSVYHKSNTNLKMIVIGTDPETYEIKCRWMDKNGVKNEDTFLFAELVKVDDYNSEYRSFSISSL
ncbi:MAG: hypothetical protein NTY07_06340 [Bacteroidia bacterium]|nr:hypothetical protein [Bacteroidia bacterium]